MTRDLPETPRQLRRQLLWTLAGTGLAIALLDASVTYVLAVRHVEEAAVERVRPGFVHFDGAAEKRLLSEGIHEDLARLLDREHFIGMRVVSADGKVIAERWADGLDPALRLAALTGRPRFGGELRRSGADAFVRVVHKLEGGTTVLNAEAFYRLDPETVHSIDPQARGAALIGAVTVIGTTLLLYPLLLGLTRKGLSFSQDLLESNLDLMRTLGSAIALRDSDTDAHNYRVALYASRLAETAGMPPPDIADLIVGAFLHDVGKVGIPDAILLKPAALTPDEFRIMQQHPSLGDAIVKNSRWLAGARAIVRHHHERFDGSGYPDGLAGAEIPLPARLFAVVDVFDALTTARPYKPALPLGETLRIMRREMADKLDPAMLQLFANIATNLFEEVGQSGDAALHSALAAEVRRYFPAVSRPLEPGPQRHANPVRGNFKQAA